MRRIENKYKRLKGFFGKIDSALIAFSGGLDSSIVAKVAFECLGKNAVAVTAKSPTYKNTELAEAKKIAGKIGIRHIIIKTKEFADKRFLANPKNRCYWCKYELFSNLERLRHKFKLKYILDGTNYDDRRDNRPGFKANTAFGVKSPLYQCRLGKDDLRRMARKLNFSSLIKPQSACLASRVPFGEKITQERLKKIAAAEQILTDFLGKDKLLRARDHDDILRIEIENKGWTKLYNSGINNLITKLKKVGYKYITVDLEGYIPAGLRIAQNAKCIAKK